MSSPLDRWIRMWSRLSGRRLEREVDEELAFHLDMRTREYESQGLDPSEAEMKAKERFGDSPSYHRQALRAQRTHIRKHKRALLMDSLRQDLQYGLRQLWRRPAFSAIALAMLALGIGANTAIFSVVYAVLLKPLPFRDTDQIVRIWESRLEQGWVQASVAPANFWDFREMNRAFEDVGAYRGGSVNLTSFDYPERLSAGRVSSGFFGRVLGVNPVAGRTFLPGEDEPGGLNRVLLLGNQFWHSRFGGSPSAIGSTLTLDGESFEIVGVLPPGRPWLDRAQVYIPLVPGPNEARASFELAVIGRLREGMTLETGLTDLERVATRLEEVYPDDLAGIGIAMAPASDWVAAPETRRALWILLGAVGFLLMIACVNLANLFLARATGRVRETAIRAASGANRGRLIRQALTESLLVSLMGAGLGLALAVWGIDALIALDPGQIPGLSDVAMNGWILSFTLGAGILTGVLTGLVPALQSSGSNAAVTLRAGGQSIAGNRVQQRLRGTLVSAEVALSLVLLVGAGLLVRSFTELLGVERGFETENRLVVSITPPGSYSPQATDDLIRQMTERATAQGSVISAAAVSIRPLSGGSTGLGFVRPDVPEPEGGTPWATWRLVTPGYFGTLGVPIVRGRDFNSDDRFAMDGGAISVIISQSIGDLLWPGEDPLGRTITLWAGQTGRPGEVLGVVGDMRERGLDSDPTLAVYFPFAESGWAPDLIIHTAGEATAIVPALRSILAEVDPNLPLSNIATMDDMVGQSVGGQEFIMLLVTLFAGVALLLALAGVYGVQSYSVAQQTSEIGVRVALGASNSQILKRIVLQAMRPAVMGVAAGLLGAFALSRFMAGMLFQVEASDPATYAGVAALLVVAALLSAWVPARRALKVDPVIAFRSD